ncbi:MAG: ACT domain-containing protein [Calditrichaceae bacterium]|nr:ACT domain-containing protein [Calditrichaceae bacterium]
MNHLDEKDIRKLTEETVKQLGSSATPELVENVVKEAIDRIQYKAGSHVIDTSPLKKAALQQSGNRIIVTAFGKNRVGILAGLTGILARHKCNILDLTQKLLQEFFTIMILVDINESPVDFDTIKTDVTRVGEELDLKVVIQHEEIFNAMHRV